MKSEKWQPGHFFTVDGEAGLFGAHLSNASEIKESFGDRGWSLEVASPF